MLIDANLLMYARDEGRPFHKQKLPNPLTTQEAWSQVEDWLAVDVVWIPNPGAGHAAILGRMIKRHQVFGNLVTDAQLAALAIEHGLTIYSTDTDFARFTEARWENPIAP